MDWYLPGNKAGGPVKSIYSLLNLLQEQYDFFIITRNTDLGSREPYKRTEPNKWIKYKTTNVYYFSGDKLNKESLTNVIDEIKADIIYINSFWSYFFSIVPLQLKKANKISGKIILAPRGMLSPGALSIKPLKKNIYLFLSKINGIYKDIIFHATSSDEEKEVKQFFPNAEIRKAHNVNSTLPVMTQKINKKSGELKLFYLSRIARVKNLHYALHILAELKTDANITYDIFGSKEDETYWKECEAVIKKMPPNIKVNYKGELSFEQVQEQIVKYHFLFLPTLNENFGHSIVESLISACPVIISDQTPWNDVNKYNCGYAVALNKEKEMTSIILETARMEDMMYKRMSENCLTFIVKKINKEENIKAYSELFL